MNKETRISEIEKIVENEKNIVGREPLLWGDDIKQMEVYNIPLEYLIYNHYNGRILSRTKSIEISRGEDLNVEEQKDFELVAKLLWESNLSRNKNTLKDLKSKGQLKTGIVTADGVIIDGNRRAMLLNRLGKKEFRAIVLPIKLDEDPIKIEELETTYQMGEDEKLGYNPIEKYLKADQIFTKLTEKYTKEEALKKISDWMGEEKSKIEHYLGIVGLIDEYLEYLDYTGVYAMADTPNDGKEDLFLHLKKWINKFKDKQSSDGFDGYDNIDVEELKFLCFDYIRAKIGKSYDGKFFRNIADGRKENHFFGNRNIWQDFKKRHEEIASEVKTKIDREMPIDLTSPNIEKHLSARDEKFKDSVLEELEENIKQHLTDLGYKRAAKKPKKLTADAIKALTSIDTRNKTFSNKEVLDDVAKVGEVTAELLRTKSINALIDQILYSLKSLEDIDTSTIIEDRDTALDKLKDFRKTKSIEKIVYELEKKFKMET